MNRIYLFPLILISVISCTRYIVDYSHPRKQGGLTAKKLKIALVGFYPFEARISSLEFRRNQKTRAKYDTELDYRRSLKIYLGMGEPVENIPSRGINQSAKPSDIKAFRKSFLGLVKGSGEKELAKLFQNAGGFLDKTVLQLKNRDVDYYVVGVHLPDTQKITDEGMIFRFASCLLSTVTVGIMPVVNEYRAHSEFFIYDGNLKFIKKYKYRTKYNSISSWWVDGTLDQSSPLLWWWFGTNRSPPASVFRSSIYSFRYDLVKFLNNKKPVRVTKEEL